VSVALLVTELKVMQVAKVTLFIGCSSKWSCI